MILSDKDDLKRVGIYVFFDKDGIVDDYVFYMLSSIRPYLSQLLVIINGFVRDEYLPRLNEIADDVYNRENVGYDITAYRDGIRRIGWEQIKQADECLLFNSTLYGPFYPFSEMFDTMNKRDVDFWGMLKYFENRENRLDDCDYDYIPEHIQSYFLLLRNTMLNSEEFYGKMEELAVIDNANDAITQFEVVFTKEFAEYGFEWDTYIDVDDLRGEEYYIMMAMPDKLISERKCPVIKQKLFAVKQADYPVFDSVKKALSYIEHNTDYDVEMIWQNMLRTLPMDEIKNMLHFNYVLGSAPSVARGNDKKTAALIYLKEVEFLYMLPPYLENLPSASDIYFICCNETIRRKNEEVLQAYPSLKYKYLANIDPSKEVLSENKDILDEYDYICFIKMKPLQKITPCVNRKLYYEKCLTNLLYSENYVQNIIQTFENERHLGMLIPKPANHSYFAATILFPWGAVLKKGAKTAAIDFDPSSFEIYEDDFNAASELLTDMDIHVPLSLKNAPVSPIDGCCWFKRTALKSVFAFKDYDCGGYFADKEDINGLFLHIPERIYSFALQNDGYYSGYLLNDEFAAIELTNEDRKINYYMDKRADPFKIRQTFGNKVTAKIKDGLKVILPKKTFKKVLKWKRRHLGS